MAARRGDECIMAEIIMTAEIEGWLLALFDNRRAKLGKGKQRGKDILCERFQISTEKLPPYQPPGTTYYVCWREFCGNLTHDVLASVLN